MKLKVISLNIWSGILLGPAIDFLKSENADILLLQEVYGNNAEVPKDRFRTLEILQENLGLDYSFFSPSVRLNRKEGKFVQGNAIFSRFPMKKKADVFFNDPYSDDFTEGIDSNKNFPHVLQSAAVDTPAGEINVFNLHGTWDLDGDNYSEKRRQMSRAIIDAVKGKSKVILAGDTNAKPTNQAIKEVEKYLISVFGGELKTTFNMKHKGNPGYAAAPVDMMFISPDLKVVDMTCPGVDISDHLPLVVTLEV